MKSYKGKVAVITGGGGTGIGNALINQLAKAGAKVAFCDIKELENTENQLNEIGNVDYYSEKVDVADKEALRTFSKNVLNKFGNVDLLINNAGIALGDRTFGQLTEADFEKITNINYYGVIYSTMFFYPNMIKRPEAAIVNLSSSQGIVGMPKLVSYCTTKFAVRGFTDSLRVEHAALGFKNITFHCVHPGAVATNITINADYHGENTEKFHKLLQNGTPVKKAAEIILKGVQKGKARIFMSDGRMQDILARLIPSSYGKVIRFAMKKMGVEMS